MSVSIYCAVIIQVRMPWVYKKGKEKHDGRLTRYNSIIITFFFPLSIIFRQKGRIRKEYFYIPNLKFLCFPTFLTTVQKERHQNDPPRIRKKIENKKRDPLRGT